MLNISKVFLNSFGTFHFIHTFRMWDTRTKEVVRSNKMADPITSFDASTADKSQLVVAHGKSVSFLDSCR